MITRKRVAIALLALALLLLSFGAGRYSRPARVEVRERVVTQIQTVEKIVNHDVVRTELVHDQAVAKNVETRIVWEKAPDGGIRTTETITDLSKTSSEVKISKSKESISQTDVAQTVKVDSSKVSITTNARPNWSVALMPGLDVRWALADGLLSSATLVKRAVLGASVERRIVGPVFGGVWGNTAGAGGVTVRLEF